VIRGAIIAGLLLLFLWGAEEARQHYERGPVIRMHGFFAWDTVNHECVEFKQIENGTAMFVTRDDLKTESACKGSI